MHVLFIFECGLKAVYLSFMPACLTECWTRIAVDHGFKRGDNDVRLLF
jgi:hypothetical protein